MPALPSLADIAQLLESTFYFYEYECFEFNDERAARIEKCIRKIAALSAHFRSECREEIRRRWRNGVLHVETVAQRLALAAHPSKCEFY